MSVTWPGLWTRVRSALASPPLPGNRHDPDVAIWSVANFVEVVPGSGGRRWKPGVEHTQLLPVVRRDAPTQIQTLHRPGWPR